VLAPTVTSRLLCWRTVGVLLIAFCGTTVCQQTEGVADLLCRDQFSIDRGLGAWVLHSDSPRRYDSTANSAFWECQLFDSPRTRCSLISGVRYVPERGGIGGGGTGL
jgi:hypothetical protein